MSRAQSQGRYLCCTFALGSKWKLVGKFYGMLYLSVKRHRFISNGKTPYERRFGQSCKGPIIPFGSLVEYHPVTAKAQSRIPRIAGWTWQKGRKVRGLKFRPKLLFSIQEFLVEILNFKTRSFKFSNRPRNWTLNSGGKVQNLVSGRKLNSKLASQVQHQHQAQRRYSTALVSVRDNDKGRRRSHPPPPPKPTPGGGAQNPEKFRAFFSSLSRHPFALFVSLWVSSRGILVVFEAPGPSNVHVWALGLSCDTPAVLGPPVPSPQVQGVGLWGFGLLHQNSMTPRETQKERNFGAVRRRGVQRRGGGGEVLRKVVWGLDGVEARRGGGPKISLFCFSPPPEISFFLLSGGLLVEFWWRLEIELKSSRAKFEV